MANEFQTLRLNERGFAKCQDIQAAFDDLLGRLDNVPQSRERSLMITKLQEASFWAKRSIAVLVENQEKTDE